MICSLTIFTISALCFIEVCNLPQKKVNSATIKSTGTIAYANTIPQLPVNEVNQFDWLNAIYKLVTVLLGTSALASIILSAIKKYRWQRKYGKSRTPIIIPIGSKLA